MSALESLTFLEGPSYQAIGPDEAQWLLTGNTFNRKPSKETVTRYVGDMLSGRWMKTGQPIQFWYDKENDKIVLLNGQQRLMAVVESGCTIVFLLVPEDSKDVFKVTDIGRPRSAMQIMQLEGYDNVTARQATVRAAINYERWKGTKTLWSRTGIGVTEISQWLKELPPEKMARLNSLLLQYQAARRAFRPTDTWYSSLAWLVSEHSQNSSRWLIFHEGYLSGEMRRGNEPILVLQRFTANRKLDSGRKAQTAWDRQAHLAVAIRAWNDWLGGEKSEYYRFTKASLPMPEIL